MNMQLKSVIHYYIGKECETPEGVAVIRSVGQWNPGDDVFVHFNMYNTISGGKYYNLSKHEVKPILRRIEDLTEEEKEKYVSLSERAITRFSNKLTIEYDTPKSFHYLLSIGIDLFGLIDSGQAIDRKTINQ